MKPNRTPRQKTRRERTERATQFCGSFLQRLRKESGLTLDDVASRLEESASYVLRIETSKRRIGVVEFMDYVQALGENPCEAMREIVAEIPEFFGEFGEESRR